MDLSGIGLDMTTQITVYMEQVKYATTNLAVETRRNGALQNKLDRVEEELHARDEKIGHLEHALASKARCDAARQKLEARLVSAAQQVIREFGVQEGGCDATIIALVVFLVNKEDQHSSVLNRFAAFDLERKQRPRTAPRKKHKTCADGGVCPPPPPPTPEDIADE